MGVPAPIDSWLARGIQAYRAGAAAPVAMSDGPSGELFRSKGQSHIRSRLDDEALAHYIAVRDGARAAVSAARVGDFAASECEFANAESFLASADPARELLMLSRSWIDQAYAYLAVRKRDWAAARSRLGAAMQADLALEEEFGYEIFHIGRVHTLHLWLRAEGEAGHRGDAVALAQEIVDYVQGRCDTLSIGSGWSRARAAAVPDDLKMAMLLRISSEAGTQITLTPPADASGVFARFTAWRDWSDDPVLSEVYDWARAKEAWLSGDTRAFLERAEAILAKGRRETTLWYATALDFCRTCETIRPAATVPFREDVRGDVATWRQLPPDVQSPGLFAVMGREPESDPGNCYRHRVSQRRFHAFTVGLPRTGSTSLYTLLTNYRSGNEFMEQQTIARIVQRHNGGFSADDLRHYLERRDEEGDLEMDSASFHHLYLDILLEKYPDARYIMTVRSPYDWANSYIKMIMGWHQRFTAAGQPLPRWMEDYGVMLFGDFSWSWVASAETVAERAEPLATAFIKHWADANRRTLSRLPAGRSLVVLTEELSRSCDRIAHFLGVAPSALTDQHHSNAHPDRRDLLSGVGRARIESMAREHGADVLEATRIDLGVPAA